MNETDIHLRGRIVTEPVFRHSEGGVPWISMRVASTARRPMPGGGFSDAHANYFTVKAWRGLAANMAASLRKGEPVLVSGRLKLQEFDRGDGSRGIEAVIEAASIGHDLVFGRTGFTKVYGFQGSQDNRWGQGGGAVQPEDAQTVAYSVVPDGDSALEAGSAEAAYRDGVAADEAAPWDDAPSGGLAGYGRDDGPDAPESADEAVDAA